MEDSPTTNHNSLDQRVIGLIQQLIRGHPVPNDRPIRTDHKLAEIGLTSMDLARLVLLIEDEFELRMPVRELIPANFRSVSTIIQLVTKLTIQESGI
jgi:acyl carrier protein